MKSFLILLAFVPILGFSQQETKLLTDSIAPDTTGIDSITSLEFSKGMIPGWNVGNSLEATGGETAWGNPLISQKLIDSVKAAGFNTIRIPVGWSRFKNAATFTIDTNFLKRVEVVVNYVLNNGMYAVMNLHWDGGWMQPTAAKQDYVNNRLAIMWKQIALHFRDYGDHLIFAGSNEVMVDGDYGAPTKEYYTAQNSFNQTFVTTVRATGGKNYYRYLAVQGFNTNIDYTNDFFTMPADVVEKKLLVEVHYYDPYDFTLNGNSSITQWGKYAFTPGKTQAWANEAYTDKQFNKMKTKFIDNGYGVIVGEYGANARLDLKNDTINNQNADFRRYYMQYVTQSIVKHGLVPIYWDNGFPGDKSMGLFNRTTGAQVFPVIINAIVDTSDTIRPVKVPPVKNNIIGFENYLKLYPNPVKEVLNIEWNDNSVKNFNLYNCYGQIIKILNVSKGNNVYNVSSLNIGLYFLQISTNKGNYTKKIIKI